MLLKIPSSLFKVVCILKNILTVILAFQYFLAACERLMSGYHTGPRCISKWCAMPTLSVFILFMKWEFMCVG